MIELVPSILTGDKEEAKTWIKQISRGGNFSRVQVDFIDGKYANNLTIEPKDIDVEATMDLKFDAHLMVVEGNLTKYVESLKKLRYDRIIAQLESISHPEDFKGLAIDIDTPLLAIEPYLKNMEVVVVMSVEPGFGGQNFIESALGKVSDLKSKRKNGDLNFRICVDGGIEKVHLANLEEAGADEAVAGAEKVLGWYY